MRLTILALGSRGDVQPYAALGKGLLDAGYRVRIATFEAFRDMVTEGGMDFHRVPGDAQALVQMAAQNNGLGTRNPLKMMRSVMQSFGQIADDYSAAFAADVLRDSDAILNQLPGGLYGVDLAEKLGVPQIMLAVIPLTPTGAFPMPLLAARSFGSFFNRQSYYLSGQLMWWFFRPKIREFRQKLGLGDASRLYQWPDAPVINGFSEQVVPRPADWGEHVHMTGYWTLNEAGWQAPDDLIRFLQAGPPPIYIGFGSMTPPDPNRLTEVLLAAVQRSHQRAILAKGWARLGNVPLPDEVFLLEYAPYAWLFPQMAAVIHHGGSGTTGLALRSGVPSMVVSFGADQAYWGRRTSMLTGGVEPIPLKHLNVENLTAAIQSLTASDAIRQQAQLVGEALAAEDGIARAVQILDRYLRAEKSE